MPVDPASILAATAVLGLIGILAWNVVLRRRLASADKAIIADAIENISEAFVLYGADGRLVLCNSKFREFYGYSEEEAAPGIHFESLDGLDTARGTITDFDGDFPNRRKDFLTDPTRTYDVRLRDGRWLQIRDRRTTDGGIVTIQADISERMEAEEAMRRVFESAPVPMSLARIDNGRILMVNRRQLEQFGPVKDARVSDFFVDPEDQRLVFEKFHRQGRIDEYELRLKDPSGRIFWALLSGRPLHYRDKACIISTVIDISERKEAEEELRAAKDSAEEARKASRKSEYALYLQTRAMQLIQRTAIAANAAANLEEAVQVCLDEVCGHADWPVGHALQPISGDENTFASMKLWHLADQDRFRPFQEATENARFDRGYGLPGRVSAGREPVWVEDVSTDPEFRRLRSALEGGVRAAVAFPVMVEDEVAVVLEFFSDYAIEPDPDLLDIVVRVGTLLSRVVERQRVTESLRLAKEAAEDANKAKSRFLATMSHELRTPLTSISGSLSLIAGGAAGEVNEDVAMLIDIANTSSEGLVSLINDILDFEKIRAGELVFCFEPVDVVPMVEQAIEANRAYGDQFGVAIRLKEPRPCDAQVHGDRNRLLQVMNNLLSNAAKFSPDNGTVEVSVDVADGMVRIGVADSGTGIPKEYRTDIFKEFSQADTSETRDRGGTGLGLSICKTIVENHRGRIDFDSEEGVGSDFYFLLPAQVSDDGKAENSAQHPSEAMT